MICERDQSQRGVQEHAADLEKRVRERTEELARANESLRSDLKQRLRWEAALEQAPVSVVITDLKGVIEYVNPKFTQVTGYSPAEAVGQNPRILKSGQQSDAVYADLWKTIAGGGSWTGEFRNRRKDGTLFWEKAHIAPVADEQGVAVRYVAVKEDISALKEAEEALLRAKAEAERANIELRVLNRQMEMAVIRANEMAKQAEAANTAKSQFLANMSHEIRTPMNGVIGMTDLLLETGLTGEQREFAQIIRRSADTLMTLINEILDLSKIEAGKLTLEDIPFDLRRCLEEICDLAAVKAHEKGLGLACLIEPGVPDSVMGDPVRIRQVLTNLLGNAVKFTAAGEVALRLALVAEKPDAVRLRFSVSDTGVGVAADRRHLLFQAFSQADSSTTRQFGGTGLGLAICKQLAELMGGEIGLQSEKGKGSVFWLEVPLRKDSQADAALRRAPVELGGASALVISASPLSRESVGLLLDGSGVHCRFAEDPCQALEALRREAPAAAIPDFLIVDHLPPSLDGEAAAGVLREGLQPEATRLVLLTPFGWRSDADRMRRAGFSACLTKPLKRAQLHGCLADLRHGPATPAASAAALETRHGLQGRLGTRPRVLIVEDNEINQKVALNILARSGFSADVVADGRAALDALAERPYGLVLMDLQMPVMDGFAATRAIRAAEAANGAGSGRLPIIALTAGAMDSEQERCLKAGMDDFISKPVDPPVLIEKVAQWATGGPGDALRLNPPPAEAGGGSGAPMEIDKALARVMGDRGFLKTLVRKFVQDLPSLTEEFAEAIKAGDGGALARRAHALKGASANLSIPAMWALAKDLEQAGGAGEPERAAQFLDMIIDEADRLYAYAAREGLA